VLRTETLLAGSQLGPAGTAGKVVKRAGARTIASQAEVQQTGDQVDADFDHLENYNSLARRELALLEVLARLTGDVIERGQSELFSRYEKTIRDYETRFQATFENAAVGIANVTPDGRLAKRRTGKFRSTSARYYWFQRVLRRLEA
jgi:hypothetical protein